MTFEYFRKIMLRPLKCKRTVEIVLNGFYFSYLQSYYGDKIPFINSKQGKMVLL
jgi:hypothetical protein